MNDNLWVFSKNLVQTLNDNLWVFSYNLVQLFNYHKFKS